MFPVCEAKKAADKWFPVELVDATDGFTAEPGKVYGDVTCKYAYEAATSLSTYSVTTDDWKEAGEGAYWLRIGASEFASAGKYTVTVAVAGCRTMIFAVEVRSYTMEDLFTGANIASIKLQQLEIINSTGSALYAQSTGGNGRGIIALGDGTGAGIYARGGAAQSGLFAEGGGSGNGAAFKSGGAAGTFGLSCEGWTNGAGMRIIGGSSAGNALEISCQAGNSYGILASGLGSGSACKFTGGATGNGIEAIGGASGGNGISATGQTTGSGIKAIGGNANGNGISAAGDDGSPAAVAAGIYGSGGDGGLGNGAFFKGSGSGGSGLKCQAYYSNYGIEALGAGSKDGIFAQGGSTGNGLKVLGGSSGGIGLLAQAQNDAHGMSCVKNGAANKDIDADELDGEWAGTVDGTGGNITSRDKALKEIHQYCARPTARNISTQAITYKDADGASSFILTPSTSGRTRT